MSRLKYLALAAFAAIAGTMSMAGTAEAKQCVYNEAGYVAEVRWFHPQDIVVDVADPNHVLNLASGASVVKDQNISLGFSSCNETQEQQTAVVSIVGGDYVIKGLIYGATTLLAIAGGIGGAVACAATVGAACVAIAVSVPALTTGFQLAQDLAGDGGIPSVFYIGTPSAYTELKIYGTVFSPQAGDGSTIDMAEFPVAVVQSLFSTGGIGHMTTTPNGIYQNVDIGWCMNQCVLNGAACTGIDWNIGQCQTFGAHQAADNIITDITQLNGAPWLHYERLY